MATATENVVRGSLLANIRFGALEEVLKPRKLNADDFDKHAHAHYTEWFQKKKGHKEAQVQLKHMGDVMKKQSSDTWVMLFDSMRKRPFFIHVVYTFILEVSQDTELTECLKSHVCKSVERIVEQKTELFNDLAMESLKRRKQVSNAVQNVMERDCLDEDYGHTFLDGIPMIRATQDAYHLVKKYFPRHNINAHSNLETLLEVIDGEIQHMEKAYQDKSKHADDNEKMLDMMTLMANQLRSQLEQKNSQFQTIDKKMDQVLQEIRAHKDEKISNILLSSTTVPKYVAGASGPRPEIAACDVSPVSLSSQKRKDLSGSDLKH